MKILFILPFIFGVLDKFSHKIHMENEVECNVCHAKAEKSGHLKDILIPEKNVCLDCHEKTYEFKIPKGLNIKDFSHKNHLKRVKTCNNCHLRDKEIVMPSMNTCYNCHNRKVAVQECDICHSGNESFFQKFHEKGFKNSHGITAKDDVEECYMCHSFSEEYELLSAIVPSCSKCHFEENVTFDVHPENFSYTHPVSFKKRESDCLSCHENYSSCITCHKNEFVYPAVHNNPEWAEIKEGGLHKKYFERDPEYCATCHLEKEPVCTGCHGGEK
jgi:hypothetical protein